MCVCDVRVDVCVKGEGVGKSWFHSSSCGNFVVSPCLDGKLGSVLVQYFKRYISKLVVFRGRWPGL